MGKQHDNRIKNDVKPLNEATKVMLDYVGGEQANIKMQLDILRKTRGQRNVGEVQIPAHLRVMEMLDASGVEERAMPFPVLGPKD